MALPDYGVDQYDIGSGFGHFGIAVEDVSFFIRCYISVKEIYVEQNRIFSTLFSLPFQFFVYRTCDLAYLLGPFFT